ncbi:MAG: DUF4870 domain-containing protein [Acidiferrobacterales bacterium]|nr:DUF4870 domain-containing protein [Acidiferrobacterales bacterium]
MRFSLGIDPTIGIQPLSVVMLLIGGLMSGLCGMILLVRRQPKIAHYSQQSEQNKLQLAKLQASGLLLFTGIPLANFFVAYWLWVRNRNSSEALDRQGIEVLNFQITIYLFLLLALFLTLVIIGLFIIPLLLLIHLLLTLFAIYCAAAGKPFCYPANIPIIQGREAIGYQTASQRLENISNN